MSLGVALRGEEGHSPLPCHNLATHCTAITSDDQQTTASPSPALFSHQREAPPPPTRGFVSLRGLILIVPLQDSRVCSPPQDSHVCVYRSKTRTSRLLSSLTASRLSRLCLCTGLFSSAKRHDLATTYDHMHSPVQAYIPMGACVIMTHRSTDLATRMPRANPRLTRHGPRRTTCPRADLPTRTPRANPRLASCRPTHARATTQASRAHARATTLHTHTCIPSHRLHTHTHTRVADITHGNVQAHPHCSMRVHVLLMPGMWQWRASCKKERGIERGRERE